MNRQLTILRFPVKPMGAPRQTQRDRWANRPVIERYHDFRDAIRHLAEEYQYALGDDLTIRFFIPMPASWSRKKRLSMDQQPHQQKPDTDNLVKAFTDALTDDDAKVWHIDATKYWTSTDGYIEVAL